MNSDTRPIVANTNMPNTAQESATVPNSKGKGVAVMRSD